MEASSGFQSDWNMNPTICRLCLHSDGFLLGIFNHLHGKDKNIYKKIIDCTALEISSGDGLPHTICHRCLFKLELCLDFRAQCFVSDSTLRQASRLAHAQQRTNSSNGTAGEPHTPLTLMDLVPTQAGDSGDVVVVVDPSAVDYDSDYDSKYGRPDGTEQYDAPNIGHYGHQMMMNDAPIAHEQIASDNETNEIADNGGEIYDFRNVFMCRYCDRAFTDKVQCTRHECDEHDAAEPYSCKTCQLTFPDRLHYSAHLKSLHADDKPYDCPECEKMFARRSDLRKHTIVHTGIKPFTCPVCSKSFSRNTNLSKHMRIHAGHKPFVCPRCPKTFITRGDLQRHSLIHSGRKPFPCRYCTLSFSRRDKLMRHEKRHFPGGMPTVTTGTTNDSGSKNRRSDYRGENMVIDIDPSYTAAHDAQLGGNDVKPCAADNGATGNGTRNVDTVGGRNNDGTAPRKRVKRAKGGILMMGHVTGDRGEEAEEEEKEEQVERELTPMEKAAKSKRYPCLQCHRRFSNMDGLKLHIAQHHGTYGTTANTSGRPFPCAQCPKGFMRKRELDRHMTTHSGMKPFSCTSCDKRFGRKDKLVRHMRIHDVSNQHTCPICTVVFTRKDSLWQHMRNHQREQQQYHTTRRQNPPPPPPPPQPDDIPPPPHANKSPPAIVAPPKHRERSSSATIHDEILSNSSNFEQMPRGADVASAELMLDPDFVDARTDEDVKPMLTEEQRSGDDVEKEKERSSEFDEEEEEEEGEYEDEDEATEQRENCQNIVEIDVDLNEDKAQIDRQDETSNSENRNHPRNSGDPDYDDLEDLEDDDDDEDGAQQHGGDNTTTHHRIIHDADEIIDCDANDSYDDDDNSSQQQIQYGASEDALPEQQQMEKQQLPQVDNNKYEFADDDLDDEDFEDEEDDDDDDDDVQMTASPHSAIF